MNASTVDAGSRLDRLPISRFHWKVLGLISAGAFLDAFDVYLAGGVMAATTKEGFSTLTSAATFISASFFGMVLGSALAGYIGDKFGRRYSYQFNLALFGGASWLACIAPNMEVLIGLRFIMGIGLGAELVVAAGTLCEFIPPSHRGRWTALMGIIITSGLLVATSVGFVVIPTLGWRWMFGIAGAGALLIWVLRKKMPESPRWLESMGRTAEAETTLAEIEADVLRERGSLPPVVKAPPAQVRQVPFSILFSKGVLGRTLVASIACVAINVTVYGFVAWLPVFFVKQGLTVVQSLGFTTLMAIGAPTGALVAYLLGDRIGRRRGLIVFSLITIALGVVYPQLRTDLAIRAVGFLLVTSIYTIVVLGLYAYIPELFPTAYRLRATGFTMVCGRAASMSTPFLSVYLFEHFGLSGVLGLVIGVLVLLLIGLLSLKVETNGQSLEDIGTADTDDAGGDAKILSAAR